MQIYILLSYGIIISMNKRHLHHVWRYIRAVHPWYFLVATIVLGAICLVSLRHNNEQMVRLRDAVYAADKANGDVEGALRDLRSYVYGHMNTSLASGPNAVHPPIQLKYTYERLQAGQQQALGQNNAGLYNQAQQYCDQQGNLAAGDLINCIDNYAASRGVRLTTIPPSLYKFDFTAAKWSPDLAGWSLVFAVISAILFVFTAAWRWWFKKYIV